MTFGESVGAGIVLPASLSAWTARWAKGEEEAGKEGGRGCVEGGGEGVCL